MFLTTFASEEGLVPSPLAVRSQRRISNRPSGMWKVLLAVTVFLFHLLHVDGCLFNDLATLCTVFYNCYIIFTESPRLFAVLSLILTTKKKKNRYCLLLRRCIIASFFSYSSLNTKSLAQE